MKHAAIEQVLQRAENAKSDSDFTYFFSMLLAGEALAKTVTLGIIAAVADDKDRNRYRLEHCLAKADGLGDWGKVVEDALTGPASQYLLVAARTEQAELTKLCRQDEYAKVVSPVRHTAQQNPRPRRDPAYQGGQGGRILGAQH